MYTMCSELYRKNTGLIFMFSDCLSVLRLTIIKKDLVEQNMDELNEKVTSIAEDDRVTYYAGITVIVH